MFKRIALALGLLLACAGLVSAGDYGFQQPFLNISATNTLDGVTINPTTSGPATFTSITVTGTSTQATVNISGTTTHTGPTVFSSTISGSGLTSYLASPAGIGGTAPAAGAFTTLSASSVFSNNGGTATQGTAFSTVETGNPLLLQTVVNVPVASVNAVGGYTFISGVTGRKVYPGIPTVMVSGTAASATRLLIECTGGNVLASIPIAYLVTNVPVTPFSSTINTAGVGITQGCATGDGVFVSNVGSSMTTTTNVYINLPYTIQ